MRSKFLFTTAFAIIASSQLAATGSDGGCGTSQVTRDPGLDLWCGETLCAWDVIRGEVERAPTWHENDAGASFVGSDTAITQLTHVDSSDGTCIQFSLLANIGERAEVVLDLDIGDDGSVEHSERFSTGDWHALKYALNMNPPYRGVRFTIRKAGSGRAVVAEIDAYVVEPVECEGFTPIVAAPSIHGAPCDDASDCASGICAEIAVPTLLLTKTCAGCDPTGANTCGAGMVCGRAEPKSPVIDIPYECVPTAADPLGARCGIDEECADGYCVDGACSACTSGEGCANGELCSSSYAYGPAVCSPNAMTGTSGEPCGTNFDCASGECVGTDRYACADGRACPGGDRELCPVRDDNTLEPGACMLFGVEGGTCN